MAEHEPGRLTLEEMRVAAVLADHLHGMDLERSLAWHLEHWLVPILARAVVREVR